MNVSENESLVGFRAVRKVIYPSASLKDFLSSAQMLAEEIDPMPGMLDPLVYAAEGLRVTIFERRIRAGNEASKLVKKVYDRMVSLTIETTHKVELHPGQTQKVTKKQPNPLRGALHDVETLYTARDHGLLVRANRIEAAPYPGNARLGTELSLVVDDGPGASILKAQRDLVMDTEKEILAGRKLSRLAEQPIQALLMPFMRAPFTSEHEREAFVELLATDLPVHDIHIGPIEWRHSDGYYGQY